MNKGVVLILCKAVVCAAVDTPSTFWDKVLSIFKITQDSYSLSLSAKVGGFLKHYMKPHEIFPCGLKNWCSFNMILFTYSIIMHFEEA